MKKLLYIDHAYHNKTKSTDFLSDILATEYDVQVFYFDPYNDSFDVFKKLQNQHFDVVVLFQIMPSVNELRRVLNSDKFVFFPMFDGAPPRTSRIWREYADVKIINFSKTLHNELKSFGFDSYYVQYFPKPIAISDKGAADSVFFWQRIDKITPNTVYKVLGKNKITHIHLHKAVDPGHMLHNVNTNWKITSSDWFETKQDMQKQMAKSALYFAPREFEGIGMSFLEAMAMGRCVIACDHPTMNEYITNGKTGYLYDIKNPFPIKIQDVSTIQKQTLEYIKRGYKQWETRKYDILEWLKTPFLQNNKVNLPKENKMKKNKLDFFALCRIVHDDKRFEMSLFGIVPLFRIRRHRKKITAYAFGIIPLYRVRHHTHRTTHYLFGFLPLLKIRF